MIWAWCVLNENFSNLILFQKRKKNLIRLFFRENYSHKHDWCIIFPCLLQFIKNILRWMLKGILNDQFVNVRVKLILLKKNFFYFHIIWLYSSLFLFLLLNVVYCEGNYICIHMCSMDNRIYPISPLWENVHIAVIQNRFSSLFVFILSSTDVVSSIQDL